MAPAYDVATAIRAGRLMAIRQAPYLAVALLRMLLVETEEVPTAAVDERWRIYLNPGFAATLTVEELAYVWLHEVGHCLRDHPARWRALSQPERLAPWFNIAGDALINADLDDLTRHRPADRIQLHLLNAPGAHRGMSTEELYRLLVCDAPDPDGDAPVDCGSGAGGAQRAWELPGNDDDGSVDDGAADLIRDTVAREIRAHSLAGSVPGGLSRWAEGRLEPVVDWHRELRAVLTKELTQRAGRRDYSYVRPARRRAPGLVLPAMVGAAPPKVAVVLDTSGSMQESDLARALAETGDLVRRMGRDRRPIRVLSCDSAVHVEGTVRAIDQVALVGGGGTDMRIGITQASKLRPVPDLVVVITDGWTPWPTKPPRPGLRVVAVLTRSEAVDQVPTWIRSIDASWASTPVSGDA